MMKFLHKKALNRKWSVQRTVQNRKRHSQPRLDAKGSFIQETVKFMAKRTFSTENNVKPSLGEKTVVLKLDLMQNAVCNPR